MKKSVILVFASFALLCCKTGKETTQNWQNASVSNVCPPNYECSFETIKDKSLVVKTDDTGHNYFNLQQMPGKMIMTYSYKKITDSNLMDAGYSETITFETDGTAKSLNLKGKDIQKANMVLNIACFCRGKAGIYKIEEGNLSYKNNKLHIEIPQLVEGQVTRVVDVDFR